MSDTAKERCFLLEEAPSTPVSKKSADNHAAHAETLVAARQDIAQFYRLERKLHQINRYESGKDPSKMADRLNALLSKNGIGGTNGTETSKAYFRIEGRDVVLVANTVVGGREVSSRNAILDAFSKIDSLIADPFSKELSLIEARISETNRDYETSTNDVFRAMDAAVNLVWGKGGDKIYQSSIDSLRANIAPTYGKFETYYFEKMVALKSKIEAGTLSQSEVSELRLMETQRQRFSKAMGAKLERPEWVTVDVAKFLWDTKWDMASNAWEGTLGVGAWTVKGFLAPFVFGYEYMSDPEVRKAVSEAVDGFPSQMKELFKHPEKIKEIFMKEWSRIMKLPPNEQSFEIGKLFGNVVGDLLFGKALGKIFTTITKSSTLRVAFKTVEETADSGTAATKASKAGNVLSKAESGVSKVKIRPGDVRSWADFEKYASQIDHIRFRHGLKSGDIISLADDIRSGKSKINAMPDVADLRSLTKKLVDGKGLVAAPNGIVSKMDDLLSRNLIDATVDGGKSALEKLRKRLSPENAARISGDVNDFHKNVLSKYGKFDDFIAGLRSQIDSLPSLLKSRASDAAGSAAETAGKAIGKVSDSLWDILRKARLAGVAEESLSKMTALADDLAKARIVLLTKETLEAVPTKSSAVVAKVRERVDKTLDVLTKPIGNANRISSRQLKSVHFSNGIGSVETKATTGVAGTPEKSVYRLVDSEGKFLKAPGKRGGFLEFDQPPSFGNDGTAIVMKEGKYGIIDRGGKQLAAHEFEFLQDFGDARKIARKNGEFFLLEKNASGGWVENRTNVFDFMTEGQDGVAVGIKLGKDGKQIRHVITSEGAVNRVYRSGVDFVDDFFLDKDSGKRLAAVSYNESSGKKLWAIIDDTGKFATHDDPIKGKAIQFKNIEAKNAAEVVEHFRLKTAYNKESAAIFRETSLFKNATRFADRQGIKGTLVPTHERGIYVIKDGGKSGFVNANTGVVIKPEFDHIIAHDASQGYLRVKKNGKWGVYDPKTGKPNFDFESRNYSSIQVQNSKQGLFEFEVETGMDTNGHPIAKKGLVTEFWEVKLEAKFDYIENPSPGTYRGISAGEAMGEKWVKSVKPETVVLGDENVTHGAGFDSSEVIGNAFKVGQNARSSLNGVQWLNVRSMSESISELRLAGLGAIENGLNGIRGLNFPSFSLFLSTRTLIWGTIVTDNAFLMIEAFRDYVKELFSAYKKAYVAEGRTLSKKESIYIDKVLAPDYVSRFEYRMLQQTPSKPFGNRDIFKSMATQKFLNLNPPPTFNVYLPANDDIFLKSAHP